MAVSCGRKRSPPYRFKSPPADRFRRAVKNLSLIANDLQLKNGSIRFLTEMNQAESLSIKVIARLLKEHGLKQTRGRMEILRILLFGDLPISQAEIVDGDELTTKSVFNIT